MGASFYEVFLSIVPSLIITVAAFQLQKHYVMSLQRIGGRLLLLIPASFAVPIHETSHYLMAKLLGHKVEKVSLFKPNGSGTLGFVCHSYKPSIFSPFTNALIGVAPIAGGALAVLFITYVLMPGVTPVLHGEQLPYQGDLLKAYLKYLDFILLLINENLANMTFWIWVLLVSNILVFSMPSPEDFEGAGLGLSIIITSYLAIMVFYGLESPIIKIVNGLLIAYLPLLLLSICLIGMVVLMMEVISSLLGKKPTIIQ